MTSTTESSGGKNGPAGSPLKQGRTRKLCPTLVLLLWGVVVAASAFVNYTFFRNQVMEMGRHFSRGTARLLADARLWNAGHGGVYVWVTDTTRPNPYLHHPRRDLVTGDGGLLTMINPAYMTRQIAELTSQRTGLLAHITGLAPLNPANAPDQWEQGVLKKFHHADDEQFDFLDDDQGGVFRYMLPLVTTRACLQCHNDVRPGDIRGGLSVTIAAAPHFAMMRQQVRGMLAGHAVAFLLVGAVIFLFMRRMSNQLLTINRMVSEQERVISDRTRALKENMHRLEDEISVRRTAEGTLRQTQDVLTTVLDNMPFTVYVVEMRTRTLIYANRFLRQRHGDDIVGQDCQRALQQGDHSCVPPDDIAGGENDTVRAWEFRNTASGEWYRIQEIALRWHDGRRVRLGIVMDTTEQKQAAELLRQQAVKYRTILATTAEGFWELDADGRTVYVNDSLCTLLGYGPEEILGQRPTDFVDGKNAAIFREQLSLRGVSLHRSYNITLRARNNEEVPCRFHSASLLDDGGTLAGSFAFVTDLSELLQMRGSAARYALELERSNRELQDFAYIASHDLQEPLRKVVAFSDLLLARYADNMDDRGRDYMERMQRAAMRMQRLIEELLNYSRVTTKASPFLPVDLNEIMAEVRDDLERRLVETNGRVEWEKLPTITADRMQIKSLLLNLVGNGLKFHRQDGPALVRVTASGADRNMLEIKVVDNGIGFDEKYIDRIFRPFQRLHGKEEYEGTGMGLAICKKIVERHHGRITAASTPGVGTTFSIALPEQQDVT